MFKPVFVRPYEKYKSLQKGKYEHLQKGCRAVVRGVRQEKPGAPRQDTCQGLGGYSAGTRPTRRARRRETDSRSARDDLSRPENQSRRYSPGWEQGRCSFHDQWYTERAF